MSISSPIRVWGLRHYLWLAAAIFAPATFALYLALTSGALSVRDYWGIIGWVYSTDGFSTSLSNWFARQNEHIVFIPRLIYALNILLNHGSNVGLSLTAWGLALAQTILLISLIPAGIRDFRVRLVMILSISGFSFAPTATDNWMHGFIGVLWILANVFVLAAIGCMSQFFRNGRWRWLVGSMILAGLGLITISTTIAVWPTLVVAFFFMRGHWRVGLGLAVVTVVILAVAFISRPQVDPGSIRTLDRVISFGPYIAIFLGSAFTTNIPATFIIGGIALALGGGLMVYYGLIAPALIRLEVLPWLLVLVFALLNGAILAYGRLPFGLESATTQRYITLSALFWISLLVLLGYWWYRTKERVALLALAPYAGLVSLLILAMLPLGLDRANRWYYKMSLQPVALLSIELGMPDPRAIEVSIVRVSYGFTRLVPALKQDNLAPYQNSNQPFDGFTPCGHWGAQLAPIDMANPFMAGAFEFIDPVDDRGGIRAIGWLENKNTVGTCLVLANETGQIKGLGLTGFDRADLDSPQKTGWIGYARLESPEEQLTAYVQPVGSTGWQPLAPTRSAQNPGQIRVEAYANMVSSTLDEHSGLESFNNFLAMFGYIPPNW